MRVEIKQGRWEEKVEVKKRVQMDQETWVEEKKWENFETQAWGRKGITWDDLLSLLLHPASFLSFSYQNLYAFTSENLNVFLFMWARSVKKKRKFHPGRGRKERSKRDRIRDTPLHSQLKRMMMRRPKFRADLMDRELTQNVSLKEKTKGEKERHD